MTIQFSYAIFFNWLFSKTSKEKNMAGRSKKKIEDTFFHRYINVIQMCHSSCPTLKKIKNIFSDNPFF